MNDSVNQNNLINESKHKHSRDSSRVFISDNLMKSGFEKTQYDKELLQEELNKYGKNLNDMLSIEEIAELIDKMNNVL
jgi:hypothetical protein